MSRQTDGARTNTSHDQQIRLGRTADGRRKISGDKRDADKLPHGGDASSYNFESPDGRRRLPW